MPTVQDNLTLLAAQLAANKSVTIGSLNGFDNTWANNQQPTPEMVIAAVGTPPGGHWETETIRPAQTITRDNPAAGYSELVTTGPVVNIHWVANPPIPAQPYVPAIPPSEIAAMTSSNTDVILQPAAGYKIVSVPTVKDTVSFNTTSTVAHTVTMLPYMKQDIIEFTVNGLRPFARHYISLDDIRIDAYATSVSNPYTYGNALISDSTGKIVGLIRIPPNTFKCGQHIVKLSDKNDPAIDVETSSAQAVFVSNGYMDVAQTTYTTTKNVTTRVADVQTYEALPPAPAPVVPNETRSYLEARLTPKSTIICTYFHEIGLMDDITYSYDQQFGAMIRATTPETYIGYLQLAAPIVLIMRNDKFSGKLMTLFVKQFALPWADEMARRMGDNRKFSIVGYCVMEIGLALSKFVGTHFCKKQVATQG